MDDVGRSVGDGERRPAAEIVREALERARAGDREVAERLCHAALSNDASCFEALALLGSLSQEDGRHEEATRLFERAGALRPEAADVLAARGLSLRNLGRDTEALAALDAAVAARPDYFEAHYNRGNVLLALGRHHDALSAFDRAVGLRPDDPGALTNRGIALHELGRFAEALACHERALAARPGAAGILVNQGNALRALGRFDAALESYEQALASRPADSNALGNAAGAAIELGRTEDAIAYADRALARDPEHVEALRHKARSLQALNRHHEALPLYEAVFAARGDADGALGIGNALQALGRYEEALAAAERALALAPELPAALINRGNALRALHRHRQALACYDKVLARQPEEAGAHWNAALTRLTLGDFARGWEQYEWRTRGVPDASGLPEADVPVWSGREEIGGKTVLLYTEQGHGDAIQFARYATLMAQRGARVVSVCRPPLSALLRTVEGVDEVATFDDEPPRADYRALLMSLPLAFGTRLNSIPADVPYVAADAERVAHWRDRVAASGARRNVGIAWRGSPEHRGAYTRDCPAEQLEPVLATRDCAFFALQLDEARDDLDAMAERDRGVVDLRDELGDFHETAAAITALDVVVSVDTAMAHLAGALGRPAWVLLQYAADWRWMLEREDSPWYPSARLFRQARPGDWQGVLRRVAHELAVFED